MQWASRQFRIWGVAVAIAAIGACVDATSPREVDGLFFLARVGSSDLPAPLTHGTPDTTSSGQQWLVADTLWLFTDGTGLHKRVVTDGRGEVLTGRGEFTYTRVGDEIEYVPACIDVYVYASCAPASPRRGRIVGSHLILDVSVPGAAVPIQFAYQRAY